MTSRYNTKKTQLRAHLSVPIWLTTNNTKANATIIVWLILHHNHLKCNRVTRVCITIFTNHILPTGPPSTAQQRIWQTFGKCPSRAAVIPGR